MNSHSFKVAKKPFQTLGHIFAKPKDPVTKEQRTDAIYSIPCNDCDHEYIGLTKRQFSTRLKEHQRLCLEAWHINSAHAPLNRDDGGLLPDAYLHLVRKKTAN